VKYRGQNDRWGIFCERENDLAPDRKEQHPDQEAASRGKRLFPHFGIEAHRS
jgi:hypothetical protein